MTDYAGSGGAISGGASTTLKARVYVFTANGGIKVSGYDGGFTPRPIILDGTGYLYRNIPALSGGGGTSTSYPFGFFDSPNTDGPEYLVLSETEFAGWGASSVYTCTFGAKIVPGSYWSTSSETSLQQRLFCAFQTDYVGFFCANGTFIVSIGAQIRNIVVLGSSYFVETVETLPIYDESTVVVHFDSNNATAENRIRIFLNGIECTINTGTADYPDQGFELWAEYDPSNYGYMFSSDETFNPEDNGPGYSGYVREAYYIDGSLVDYATLYPEAGSYSGSYGNRGFYLKFDDTDDLGKDSSGLGNHLLNDGTDLVTLENLSFGGGGGAFSSVASGSRMSFRTEAYVPSTVTLGSNALFAFEETSHSNSCALKFDGTSAALRCQLLGTKGAAFAGNTDSGMQAIIDPTIADLTKFSVYLELLSPSTRTVDWDTFFTLRDRYFKFWSDANNAFSIGFSATTKEIYAYSYVGDNLTIDVWSSNAIADDEIVPVLVVVDTTQAIASDRVKIYINGTLDVDSGSTFPAQDSVLYDFSDTQPNFCFLGLDRESDGISTYPFEGNIYRVIFVPGQALVPADFSGGYSGTYGTSGFHLEFNSASQLGKDLSDNSVDFATPPGVTALTSSLFDVLTTTTVSKDTWTSVGFDFDSSQSTASNRMKIYIGDTLASIDGSSVYPSTGMNLWDTFVSPMFKVGSVNESGTEYGFEGKIRNVGYSDGIAIYSTDLQYSFSGPYGPSGWHLKFLNAEDLGADSSINNLDFTPVNVTADPSYNYDDIYGEVIQGITFELVLGTTPEVIGLSFRLYSGETVTPTVTFDISAEGYDLTIPLKLYGSGEVVTPIIVFQLLNTEEYSTDITHQIEYTSLTGVFDANYQVSWSGASTGTGYIVSDNGSNTMWINLLTGDAPVTNVSLSQSSPDAASATAISVSETAISIPFVWRVSCILNGVDISSRLFGEVSIEVEEDASSIASFSFVPDSGSIDPLVYVGTDVILSWSQCDLNNTPIFSVKRFTGKVADVNWNPDTRTIEVSADTQLPAKFNSMPKEEIESFIGGLWSDQVWADEDDKSGWTYAQERLSTTTDFVWTDANGALRKDSLLTNRVGGVPTPHFTFTDTERFHESLSLEYAQRSEMTNFIQVSLTYSYQRKRQREITFNWNEFVDTDACNFLVNCEGAGMGNYQLCQRTMVESAASSAGWVAVTPITYTPVWSAGAYSCSNPCSTSSGPYSDLYVWNITTVSGFVNGEETSTDPVTGETTKNEGFAYDAAVDATHLCIGASWRAAMRWLQDVDENYDIIIKAPDSIEAIGEVKTTEEYSLTNEIDNSAWEEPLTPFESPSMQDALILAGSDDKYYNADENIEDGEVTRADLEMAQEVIIASARGDIIRAHRLNSVTFKIAYQPTVTLSHTVKVDTPYLVAIGKVKSIRDTWSIDTGEASTELTLAISRHNGSGAAIDDPVEAIPRPEPSEEPAIPRYVRLHTYKGGRATSHAYDEEAQTTWEGFLTNYLDSMQPADYSVNKIDNPLMANKTYPYSFVVRGPEITEEHTTAVEVIATQEYIVSVPQDTLTLTA